MILNHRSVKGLKWYQSQQLSTSKYVYFLTLLSLSGEPEAKTSQGIGPLTTTS